MSLRIWLVNNSYIGGATTGGSRRGFPPTRWDVFEGLRQSGEEPDKSDILDTLIRLYWKPVYCYIRRRGYPCAEAKDLTQGFFLQWLNKKSFLLPRRERGRFRTLLLASLDNYLRNQHRAGCAKKRTPAGGMVSLDVLMEHEGSPLEPRDHDTPETAFNRAWAREFLLATLDAFKRECSLSGKELHFRIFQVRVIEPLLEGVEPPRLDALAAQLGLSAKQAGNCMVTSRRAFQRLLREMIQCYATGDEEAQEEIQALFTAFSRGS